MNQDAVVAMSKYVELRQLELFACRLKSKHHKGLTQILQNLSKLEVLKFIDTGVSVSVEKELREIEDVQLPNLKTVVISQSSAAVSYKEFNELWLSGVNFFFFF